MTFWDKLRIFGIFIRVQRNPERTDLIIKGIDIASNDPNHEALKEVEKKVLSIESFRSMFERNYLPEPPSMKVLRDCPEGSFGHALFKHMDENCLGFEVFPRYDSHRLIKYLTTRIYQDHDLWHTVLGYGVSIEDELAIQAFAFAQYQSPIALMLMSGGILNLLRKNPKKAIAAFNKMIEGHALGKKAPFLLSIRLHDLFGRPLAEVRQICGVA